MMSATGPKNLRVAGSLADRVMLYVGVNRDSVRWAMEHVRAGAEEAGATRPRSGSRSSRRCGSATTRKPRGTSAAGRPRPARTTSRTRCGATRTTACPSAMTRLPPSRDEYDYYAGHLSSDAEHTGYLTGELIDDFAIAGTAEKVRDKVHELDELGIDEISCAYLNGEHEQMALVGREIISGVATATARRRNGMKRIGVDVGGTFTDLSSSTRRRAGSPSTRSPPRPTTPPAASSRASASCAARPASTLSRGRQPPARHHGGDQHRAHAHGRRGRDDHDRGLPRHPPHRAAQEALQLLAAAGAAVAVAARSSSAATG